MRDLWRMIEAVKAKGHMVRLAFFPGGNMNVSIYDSEKQMQQKMYDAHSYEQLEEMMRKDWGHLIGMKSTVPHIIVPTLGLPPLPKLPGLK